MYIYIYHIYILCNDSASIQRGRERENKSQVSLQLSPTNPNHVSTLCRTSSGSLSHQLWNRARLAQGTEIQLGDKLTVYATSCPAALDLNASTYAHHITWTCTKSLALLTKSSYFMLFPWGSWWLSCYFQHFPVLDCCSTRPQLACWTFQRISQTVGNTEQTQAATSSGWALGLWSSGKIRRGKAVHGHVWKCIWYVRI